jgi:hypothetical protein
MFLLKLFQFFLSKKARSEKLNKPSKSPEQKNPNEPGHRFQASTKAAIAAGCAAVLLAGGSVSLGVCHNYQTVSLSMECLLGKLKIDLTK